MHWCRLFAHHYLYALIISFLEAGLSVIKISQELNIGLGLKFTQVLIETLTLMQVFREDDTQGSVINMTKKQHLFF